MLNKKWSPLTLQRNHRSVIYNLPSHTCTSFLSLPKPTSPIMLSIRPLPSNPSSPHHIHLPHPTNISRCRGMCLSGAVSTAGIIHEFSPSLSEFPFSHRLPSTTCSDTQKPQCFCTTQPHIWLVFTEPTPTSYHHIIT